ncbi:cation diffusion facilitator family transporter [Pseudoruegeria sp. SHC-113]|uniref:cation diffusion facilitator family transporter n=1 Tax=Pseudoruegeria sp. SHC-113 TaxID=2855439 RepID=UPI0021BB14C9|nr:cation diffusion facilitator family transporter [Pseudoruegeria sp. SHC-113]MCT8161210.1 cation diffusion facilitator family transporter [Pseudoruegeria sp. SHC-113]
MLPTDRSRLGAMAGIASTGVALTLVLLKLWALAVTGSLSVASSLTDNALDLLMSLGALAAILYAARPPDEDHAFGHSSAEDLAALGQAAFILVAAALISIAAISRLLSGDPPDITQEGVGMAIIAVSVVLTLALVLFQRYVVAKTGNRVVAADSLHYLSDLVPNLGAIVALFAASRYGMNHLDSGIALATAAMLVVSALHIGKGAWDALMDRAADPKLVAEVEKIVDGWPGVQGHHDLRSRSAGSQVFINMHIEVDGSLTLFEAHEIGAALKREICTRFPEVDLIIHKDPAH